MQTKRQIDCDNNTVEKKSKRECILDNLALSLGKAIKFTGGNGEERKFHYQAFEFHRKKYELEDSVMLVPEDANQKPYIAIIKDIYVLVKEGEMKLSVQWLYRPEDVEKKHIRKWSSNHGKDLFYSFHMDEVDAESVKRSCVLHFVPSNKKIPNLVEHPGYIVQNVYDVFNKKLLKLDCKDFTAMQKLDIDIHVAKTISRLGDLPDIVNERNVVNSILEKFEMLTGDLERDKGVGTLLESVKHACRVTKKQKASDYDYFWPDDVVHMVRALEQLLYDSLGQDTVMYGQKLEVLVNKLKNSQILVECLLDGNMKLEEVIKMTTYKLKSGHAFDQVTTNIKEPKLQINDPSTSKNVGA